MKEKTIFPREEKSEVLFDKMTLGLTTNFSRHSVTICFAMMILKQYFHRFNSQKHYSTAILIRIYPHF